MLHLEEKGVFVDQGGSVQVVVSRPEYETRRSRSFVGEVFGGSLLRFMAAFTGGRPLKQEEADEPRRFIESYQEE